MPVNLDHNATSLMHPDVLDAMISGVATQLVRLETEPRRHHVTTLRDTFEARLVKKAIGIEFGRDVRRPPDTSQPNYNGDRLPMGYERTRIESASSGSCHKFLVGSSFVLKAMGIDLNPSLNAIRGEFWDL